MYRKGGGGGGEVVEEPGDRARHSWVLGELIISIAMYSLTCVFSYEVTSTKFSRNLFKELLISLWSAVFLGFGVLFLMLWVGIYV